MGAAWKLIPRTEPEDDVREEVEWLLDHIDEPTGARRIRVVARTHGLHAAPMTRRMKKVDSQLIAIARGELAPEDVAGPMSEAAVTRRYPADLLQSLIEEGPDPFGGLIPVEDDDLPLELTEGWLDRDPEGEASSS